MFVIMCGWPWSGKSTFVKALASELNIHGRDPSIIDPTIGYPDNIDQMKPSERSAYAIAAWEVAIEEAKSILSKSDNNTIVILDTTGSNSNVIGPIVDAAAMKGHRTLFIKIDCGILECKSRSNGKWIDQDAEDKYKNRFNSNVTFLEGICHSSMTVINEGPSGKANIEKQAKELGARIHQQVA